MMFGKISARWIPPSPASCDARDSWLLRWAHDDGRLVGAIRTLPYATLEAIAKDSGRAQRLLHALADADCDGGLWLLRLKLIRVVGHKSIPGERALAERAWSMGRPKVAYGLVASGHEKPKDFMARFPKASAMWLRLVEDSHMKPGFYLEHFHADTETLARWLNSGELSQQRCLQLLGQCPEVVEDLRALGVLPDASALVRCRQPAQSLAQRLELLPPYSRTQPPGGGQG